MISSLLQSSGHTKHQPCESNECAFGTLCFLSELMNVWFFLLLLFNHSLGVVPNTSIFFFSWIRRVPHHQLPSRSSKCICMSHQECVTYPVPRRAQRHSQNQSGRNLANRVISMHNTNGHQHKTCNCKKQAPKRTVRPASVTQCKRKVAKQSCMTRTAGGEKKKNEPGTTEPNEKNLEGNPSLFFLVGSGRGCLMIFFSEMTIVRLIKAPTTRSIDFPS